MNDLREAATSLAGPPPALADIEHRAGVIRSRRTRARAALATLVVLAVAGIAALAASTGDGNRVISDGLQNPFPSGSTRANEAAWNLAVFAHHPSADTFEKMHLNGVIRVMEAGRTIGVWARADLRDPAGWVHDSPLPLLASVDEYRFAPTPSGRCGSVPIEFEYFATLGPRVVIEPKDDVPCDEWFAIDVHFQRGQIAAIGVQRAHAVPVFDRAHALVALAKQPSGAAAAAVGFADEVKLYQDGTVLATRSAADLGDPAGWVTPVLDRLRTDRPLTIGAGVPRGCGNSPEAIEDGLDFDQQVYIHPPPVEGCADWFRVTLFVRHDLVIAVGFDLDKG